MRRLHLAPLRGRAVILVLAAVTWVPLLLLAVVGGTFADNAAIPFLYDIAVHARFLVAVPLLVFAEGPIGAQLDRCTAQFLVADLVRPADRAGFAALIADARLARDARIGTLVVLAAAYATSVAVLVGGELRAVSSWYVPGPSRALSLAGQWYVFVSLPIFHFVLYRWIHRLFVWGRFLRRVSRLDLRLTPTHPDRAGGLGFLGKSSLPMAALLLAAGVVTASAIATRILFEGMTLDQLQASYVAVLLLGLFAVTGPMLVFVPKLMRLKMRGTLEHGALASRYVQLFEHKWVADPGRVDASILGSSDLQSLADLATTHEVVRTLRPVPLERADLAILLLAGLLPALPLLGTTVPVREFLRSATVLLP